MERDPATRRLGSLARHLASGAAAASATDPGAGRYVTAAKPGAATPNRIEDSATPSPAYTHVPRLPCGSQASADYLSEHGVSRHFVFNR